MNMHATGEAIRICSRAELPANGCVKGVFAAGRALCLVHVNGIVSALKDECPHRGAPLSEGAIEDGHLVCPWHAWTFDPVSGTALHDPQEKVQRYELTVEGEDVFIKP